MGPLPEHYHSEQAPDFMSWFQRESAYKKFGTMRGPGANEPRKSTWEQQRKHGAVDP